MDFVKRTVTFDLDVWIGDLDSSDVRDRERYRAARLVLAGLLFCHVEPPDPRYPFQEGAPLRIDLSEPDARHPLAQKLPESAFAGRFYVSNWNAFIHFAGCDADLLWADDGLASPSPSRLFLNVDLDVESTADLTPLVEALAPYTFALERPAGRASFELNEPVMPTDPEPLILEFVRLVKALPSSARALWDGASRRVFDIGIQSGRRPLQEAHHLAPTTLLAAAEVGAEIAFTIYALAVENYADRAG